MLGKIPKGNELHFWSPNFERQNWRGGSLNSAPKIERQSPPECPKSGDGIHRYIEQVQYLADHAWYNLGERPAITERRALCIFCDKISASVINNPQQKKESVSDKWVDPFCMDS